MSDDDIESLLAAFDRGATDDTVNEGDRIEALHVRFEQLRTDLIRPELQTISEQLIDHGHLADLHAGGSGSVGPFVDLMATRMGRPPRVDARLSFRFLTTNGRVSIETMVGDDDTSVEVDLDDVTKESIRANAAAMMTKLLA